MGTHRIDVAEQNTCCCSWGDLAEAVETDLGLSLPGGCQGHDEGPAPGLAVGTAAFSAESAAGLRMGPILFPLFAKLFRDPVEGTPEELMARARQLSEDSHALNDEKMENWSQKEIVSLLMRAREGVKRQLSRRRGDARLPLLIDLAEIRWRVNHEAGRDLPGSVAEAEKALREAGRIIADAGDAADAVQVRRFLQTCEDAVSMDIPVQDLLPSAYRTEAGLVRRMADAAYRETGDASAWAKDVVRQANLLRSGATILVQISAQGPAKKEALELMEEAVEAYRQAIREIDERMRSEGVPSARVQRLVEMLEGKASFIEHVSKELHPRPLMEEAVDDLLRARELLRELSQDQQGQRAALRDFIAQRLYSTRQQLQRLLEAAYRESGITGDAEMVAELARANPALLEYLDPFAERPRPVDFTDEGYGEREFLVRMRYLGFEGDAASMLDAIASSDPIMLQRIRLMGYHPDEMVERARSARAAKKRHASGK